MGIDVHKLIKNPRPQRASLKESPFKGSKFNAVKDSANSELPMKQYKRKTTMENKRLGNLRLSKISK